MERGLSGQAVCIRPKLGERRGDRWSPEYKTMMRTASKRLGGRSKGWPIQVIFRGAGTEAGWVAKRGKGLKIHRKEVPHKQGEERV